MDSQYGIPKKEVEILRQQAAQRAANRQLFLKEVSNPHRHALGEGGYFFDPAIQRFNSLQPTMYDHFKATPKTALRGLMYFVGPLSILYYIVWKDVDTREKKIRSGQVAYRDREFKFV